MLIELVSSHFNSNANELVINPKFDLIVNANLIRRTGQFPNSVCDAQVLLQQSSSC